MKTKPIQDIEERAVILGSKATVRARCNTNKFVSHFGVSKSKVYTVDAN